MKSFLISHKSTLTKALLSIAIFAAGFYAGFKLEDRVTTETVQSVREESSDYRFISPLLFTKISEDLLSGIYDPLEKLIAEYTAEAIDDKDVSDVSVYFRNLQSNEWFSINPEGSFNPASMLKVVTLISTLRLAEADPSFLSKPIAIRGEDTALVESQVRYPVENPIRSGKTYTVQTLIDHLIIESDNVANVALSNLIGEDRINKTYRDLQLPLPEEGKGYTAQEYSRLFRALYNGTYLSHSISEKVLDLLSQTMFDKGLVAGVPVDTTVSHKFGIKTLGPLIRELHDCGIIYYPDDPYFLCVMTRGDDFSKLETIIEDISKISWDFMFSSRK